MDNDQPNTQPLIPANATVDFKLSGEYDRYSGRSAPTCSMRLRLRHRQRIHA